MLEPQRSPRLLPGEGSQPAVNDGNSVIGIVQHMHIEKYLYDRLELCWSYEHCHSRGIDFFSFLLFRKKDQYHSNPSLMGMQCQSLFQIHDYGHIVMTSPSGKLVNANIMNVLEHSAIES